MPASFSAENLVSVTMVTVAAQDHPLAAKPGLLTKSDLAKLYDVVSAGGGNSKMFQMMMPWVLDGDDSHLRGPLRIAGKDMRYYAKLAESAPATALSALNVLTPYCREMAASPRVRP